MLKIELETETVEEIENFSKFERGLTALSIIESLDKDIAILNRIKRRFINQIKNIGEEKIKQRLLEQLKNIEDYINFDDFNIGNNL